MTFLFLLVSLLLLFDREWSSGKKRKEEVVHSIETWQEAVRSNKLCNQRSREPSLQQQKRKNEERERERSGCWQINLLDFFVFSLLFHWSLHAFKECHWKGKIGFDFCWVFNFFEKIKSFWDELNVWSWVLATMYCKVFSLAVWLHPVFSSKLCAGWLS